MSGDTSGRRPDAGRRRRGPSDGRDAGRRGKGGRGAGGQSGKRAEAPGVAARRGALTLVTGVLERGHLMDEGKIADLDPAVRAEAHGLADLVLRHLPMLDDRLSAFVQDPPPGPGRQILRILAAEIDLAGTADHAAVDTAVRLAQSIQQAVRLSGLINAVGRRLAASRAPAVDAGSGGGGARDPLSDAPRWLSDRLVEDWGAETARAILTAHRLQPAHDLTPRNAGDGELLAEELDAMLLPSGTLRLRNRPKISGLPGYRAGAWWVQDAAAALPMRLLGDVAGKRVLDLCAAPGAKTMQLAAAGAQVTALDISEKRMGRLRENLERTGLAADCVVADAFDWVAHAPFDAVLLDAPCSATGTIRRHPDLPHRFDPASLDALTALQAALIGKAASWLRPGGVMVYATCSLFRAEGEAQIATALEAGLHATPISADLYDLPPVAVDAEGHLRTLPSMLPEIGGLDGFFAARFHRT
ncbi:MAG: RsmB/NOP family class I SAM-dependent RNA methyltransferase [Pseudomonadota bacterium]